MPPGAHWEHFAHTADLGVRGYGRTPDEAFEQAALALVAAAVDPARVQPLTRVEITLAGRDREMLLYDWLNALVGEMACRRLLFGRFRVRLDEAGLHGAAWGEPVDVLRHEPAVEIKGATATELRVARDGSGGWLAQCVVDV